MPHPHPNFFVVGAAKSGTTSLYHYLKAHPDVFLPDRKEPHYYSGIDLHPKLEVLERKLTLKEDYLRLFAGASGARAVGEASTSYLWERDAARRIHDDYPSARVIAILREPVSRCYSHYLHNVREAVEDRSFAEVVRVELQDLDGDRLFWQRYVALGLYCEQVRRYRELFGERLLVLFYEEFYADIERGMEQVYSFLQLDPPPSGASEREAHNVFGLPRNAVTRRLLSSRSARAIGRALVPPSLRWKVKGPLLRHVERPPIDGTTTSLLRNAYVDQYECLTSLLDREPPWERSTPDERGDRV